MNECRLIPSIIVFSQLLDVLHGNNTSNESASFNSGESDHKGVPLPSGTKLGIILAVLLFTLILFSQLAQLIYRQKCFCQMKCYHGDRNTEDSGETEESEESNNIEQLELAQAPPSYWYVVNHAFLLDRPSNNVTRSANPQHSVGLQTLDASLLLPDRPQEQRTQGTSLSNEASQTNGISMLPSNLPESAHMRNISQSQSQDSSLMMEVSSTPSGHPEPHQVLETAACSTSLESSDDPALQQTLNESSGYPQLLQTSLKSSPEEALLPPSYEIATSGTYKLFTTPPRNEELSSIA